MIIGLGTDVAAIERIRSVWERQGQLFLDKVFTTREQAYCLGAADPAERLASRWAAKEAAMKALGTGWTQGVHFALVEVASSEGSAPQLRLHGAAADHAKRLGITRLHLSLSHEAGVALAVVIMEGEPS